MKKLLILIIGFALLPTINFAEQINVQARSGKKIIVHVDPTSTVAEIKGKIEDKEGIPHAKQRLIFSGKELADSKKLVDYGIKQNDTVHIQLKEK